MRQLSPDLDPAVVAEIDARLAGIRADEQVAIPWAVESGSRAWGFPSPDSDYDCRFLFVRRTSDYLDPWPPRDVVETPLVGLLDVNGWDLAKAVRLAVRGNATVGEWLRSPLVYAGESEFRDDLLAMIDELADRSALIRHYLHVGRDHWDRSGAAHGHGVVLKRVFYAIRPATTLHWMTGTPERSAPPMNLGELLAEAPPPPEVREAIDVLLAAKAVSRELGSGTVAEPLVRWVEEQFAAAAPYDEMRPRPEQRGPAAAVFRELLARWAPD